jgi:hypothetical protein
MPETAKITEETCAVRPFVYIYFQPGENRAAGIVVTDLPIRFLPNAPAAEREMRARDDSAWK